MLGHDFILIRETNVENYKSNDYFYSLFYGEVSTSSTTIIDKCIIDDDLIMYNLDLFEKLPILKIETCTNLIGLEYYGITVIPRSSFTRLLEISEKTGADELIRLLDENMPVVDDDCYIVHDGI
jgi:hypothetical protein